MRTRLIAPIGLTITLSLDRRGPCAASDEGGRHWATREIAVALDDTWGAWAAQSLEAIPAEEFPTVCRCGLTLDPLTDDRSRGTRHRYDTASGRPEPGDLFWNTSAWNPATKQHDARHLIAVCPNGISWDIDGPASTGGRWTRTGEPPAITVTPSIWIQSAAAPYHGFLQNGVFTPDLDGHVYPGCAPAAPAPTTS